MRIYLLRHGETDWNVIRRLQGSLDTPLNNTGIRQAEDWRSFFERTPLAGVYSSGMDRALHTAALATRRPACIIDAFNERRFGEWEGMLWTDLERTVSEFDTHWRDNAFCPPRGESRLQLFDRVRTALTEIVATHKPEDQFLIVAHGASGHAILMTLLNMPIEDRDNLPTLTNASLATVDVGSNNLSFLKLEEKEMAV